MAKEDLDDLLPPPKKPGGKKLVPDERKPSAPMLRLVRIARVVGLLLGGFVTLVGFMGVVGLVTDSFWVRFGVASVVGIVIPAVVADRLLKRLGTGGGLSMVVDVFAIVLLALGVAFAGLEGLTRGLLRDEGDRYAKSGSRTMARAVYFLAGVSPTFPGEAGWKGGGAARAGKPGADAGAPDGGAR